MNTSVRISPLHLGQVYSISVFAENCAGVSAVATIEIDLPYRGRYGGTTIIFFVQIILLIYVCICADPSSPVKNADVAAITFCDDDPETPPTHITKIVLLSS